MRHTMEGNVTKVVLGCIAFMQFMTIVFVLGIPTEKVEMVCVGIYDNPNAVRCYQQWSQDLKEESHFTMWMWRKNM